jgi:O-antigen ligase
LFVARVRSPIAGASIVVLSLIFLLFSFSKTAIALLPVVMIVSFIAAKVRPALGMTAGIGGVLLLNLISIGSAYSASIRAALGTIVDASFTGRTDIWQFALEHLAQRPITGYGFSAFWGTENVVYGMSQSFTWASNATDAHNAYLNIALTVGVPGLLLVLVWIILLPLVDFYRQSGDRNERLLAILFFRVWLFGIYASSFESTLFQQVGEVWFVFVVAVFGLRFLSVSRVRA